MPGFPYAQTDYEQVPCNFCGDSVLSTLAKRDRNRLCVRTCICTHCGLIFINPRMTPRWYAEYYKEEYRAQMARFRGKAGQRKDEAILFEQSTRHGVGLAKRLGAHWKPGLTVEVGSSVGGVLNGLKQRLPIKVIGIEPSPSEAEMANRKGIKTYCALMESFKDPLPKVANILCTQSLNHLLDPRLFFIWAHQHLEAAGRLVLEVANFRHLLRHWGWMPRAIQIDHTYMFVPEVLSAMVEAAGFQLLVLDNDEEKGAADLNQNKADGLPRHHCRLIAAKLPVEPFASRDTIKPQYQDVRASLDRLPNSRLRYLRQYGLKAWRRRTFG